MTTMTLRAATGVAMWGLAACASGPMPIETGDMMMGGADAAAIHERVMTLDTHVDIPLTFATADTDPGGFTASQVDLPKMRAGGLDAAFFILYVGQGPLTEEGYASARDVIETKWSAITRMAAAYPEEVALATSADEARAAYADGKLVAFMGIENGYPLGESVADVPMWAARGVRYVGVTHFGHNQFGDSSNPNAELGDEDSRFDGLSPLGEELVEALNVAGVMVDVSHAAKATMMDAVALSRAPILASHSGASGVNANPRNLDDEQLRAIADNGGVAQMVAFAGYLKPVPPERTEAIAELAERFSLESLADVEALGEEDAAAFEAAMATIDADYPPAGVSEFVDHIDHAVAVAGIDHVGIASDFDGGGGVAGWMNALETGNVTDELVRRGYAEADIAKIWSGNLLRVLDDVERVGRELRGAE